MDISVEDYVACDAVALADLVRRRQIPPEAPLAAALALTEALDPKINAIVERFEDHARREAAAAQTDAPLAAVPFLVKDNNVVLAGRRPRNGSALYRTSESTLPESDIARVWRGAGLVIFGRTNMCEFAHSYSTEPRVYGPTRNPWQLEHSAGGSSGGSAAAVAAHIVPVAHGNDAGGSIRVPAAACGVFGLKPTRDFTSLRPHFLEVWHGLNVDHVLTRSVRDSAVFLDLARRLWPHATSIDSTYARLRPIDGKQRPLRIGLSFANPVAGPLAGACREAVVRTGTLLEDMGHTVVEADFPTDPAAGGALVALITSGVNQTIADEEARIGREATGEEIEPAVQAYRAIARSQNGPSLAGAIRARQCYELAASSYFDAFDVFLSPVVASLPPPIGVLDGARTPFDPSAYIAALQSFAPYTARFNLAGLPAMSVPMGHDEGGLPIGVQFAAAHWREDVLISLALAIEEALPWSKRSPPILDRYLNREGATANV
jgi:amidase